MKKIILIIIILIITFSYLAYRLIEGIRLGNGGSQTEVAENYDHNSLLPEAEESEEKQENILVFPVDQFRQRITKKPFGIYITPQNSPVQPERFNGYHTGVDIEYEDKTADVPVFAVADGVVRLARTASGYGGVVILEIELGDTKHSVVYGHIRPSSLPQKGEIVKKGDSIGLLGTSFSTETDGERRHLHFAVLSNNSLDLLGYVQNKSELAGWIDPEGLFGE